jgi:hypothetical protein
LGSLICKLVSSQHCRLQAFSKLLGGGTAPFHTLQRCLSAGFLSPCWFHYCVLCCTFLSLAGSITYARYRCACVEDSPAGRQSRRFFLSARVVSSHFESFRCSVVAAGRATAGAASYSHTAAACGGGEHIGAVVFRLALCIFVKTGTIGVRHLVLLHRASWTTSLEFGLTWSIWHHAGVCLVEALVVAVLWLALSLAGGGSLEQSSFAADSHSGKRHFVRSSCLLYLACIAQPTCLLVFPVPMVPSLCFIAQLMLCSFRRSLFSFSLHSDLVSGGGGGGLGASASHKACCLYSTYVNT